ncbi:hypothetical protein JOD69_004092 [Methylocaldum sp. RMAD-M]|jgi:hypothetical protein|nr:hypothetical protein [Methylocaldum sp. RMAD-M]
MNPRLTVTDVSVEPIANGRGVRARRTETDSYD